MKRGRIRPVSKKRAAQLRQRAKVRKEVLTRDGFTCRARGGLLPGRCWGDLDVHEVVSRGRGGSFLDPENCVTLCRRHHDWVGANIAEAEAKGWLKSLTPQPGLSKLTP